MKKYLIIAAIVAASIAASASAATGSTSTGSTSTGSTSTGTTSTGVVVQVQKGAGGLFRSYNFTTKQIDMVPQCFPWVWLVAYYKGNIFDMYLNQAACQAQRKIDFGM